MGDPRIAPSRPRGAPEAIQASSPPNHRSPPQTPIRQDQPGGEDGQAIGSPGWWLTQAPQFLVDDDAHQPVGVVDEVHTHPDTGLPHELVVVQGWGRRWVVIPIDAVARITPADRRLIVRRSTRQRWRTHDPRRSRGILRRFGRRIR